MTHDYTNTWNENPLQILEIPTDEIIVVPELSGRSEYKRDPKKVKELAASIQLTGQLQPATVGVNTDEALGAVGAPILHYGFGRLEACIEAQRPILCQFSERPIGEVLLAGMHENTKREDLSPIQVAANIQRLNDMGMKDGEIARGMGWSPSNVSIYKKFNALADDGATPLFSKFAKTAIHKREIPTRAAFRFHLLESPEAIDNEIKKLLDESEATGKPITSTAVSNTLRKAAKGKTRGKKKKSKALSKQRTIKELIDFLTEWDVAGVPKAVRTVVQQVKAFATGEKEAEDVTGTLMKIAA
jgi:ParB/RepB/Spo0J family partition protein